MADKQNTPAQAETATVAAAKTEKGIQVSCVLTPAELAAFEDYRFDKQSATRTDVKRSDVVREAVVAFLKNVPVSA